MQNTTINSFEWTASLDGTTGSGISVTNQWVTNPITASHPAALFCFILLNEQWSVFLEILQAYLKHKIHMNVEYLQIKWETRNLQCPVFVLCLRVCCCWLVSLVWFDFAYGQKWVLPQEYCWKVSGLLFAFSRLQIAGGRLKSLSSPIGWWTATGPFLCALGKKIK